jgi:hypothetical protein
MSIEVKTEATCAQCKKDALMSAFNDYYKRKFDLEQLDNYEHARELVRLIECERDKIGFFKTISFGATQRTRGFGKRLRISANNVLDSFLNMKMQLQMIDFEQAYDEGVAEANKEALAA